MTLSFNRLTKIFLATLCLQFCLLSTCENVYPFMINDKVAEKSNTISADCSFAYLPQNRANCFIVVSKKDFYLYVYEKQNTDTVLLARYDCAIGRNEGNKIKNGDCRTPHCTAEKPYFTISEICNSSYWCHDFNDGRGNILAYGKWFLRLDYGVNRSSIGIHGSTNNEHTIPGRFSQGCIRLKDEHIDSLKRNYVFVGMKVIVKGEEEVDLPFEERAFERQAISRVRNL